MRLTKTQSCLGVVALLGATALTIPAAQGAVASGNPVSVKSAVPRAAVDSLVDRTGIDAARAERFLAAQPAIIKRGQHLVTQLGDRSAGVFLQAPSQKPVITVLDSAAAKKVRAAGGTAKIVRHSSAELRHAKNTLDRASKAPKTKVPDTSWGTDTAANQVVLQIGSAAKGHPNLDALLATAKSLGDLVRVEHFPGKGTPIMSMGDEIKGPLVDGVSNSCSLGFNVNNGVGNNYVITAGHCVEQDGTYFDGSWNRIGERVAQHYGGEEGGDWGLITAPDETWPSRVNGYGQNGPEITGTGSVEGIPQGTEVCKSGATTGVTCGTVQYDDVWRGDVKNLLQAKIVCDRGDSGGPLYLGNTGLGIASQWNGSAGDESVCWFYDVKPILDSTKLVLNPANP
ncbi:S1 family peptidase [Streptomyces sp. ISID311]|uniref:S1 family peptidase n=1 Tax=Streptomyces sp. ISID311 TaxID=2601673 RepID=UPI0011BD3626|nr:S1 family peptidase [Streptomyces sp. ISID311]TXC97496.1 S1 family peptidase [Streptomyces sp. ISID311]